MDELPIDQILSRSRAALTDEVCVAAAVSGMTIGSGASVKRADATLLCFQCNQPNHFARDGVMCVALIDSGCSHCIVHALYCASWTRKRADVMTMSGERQRCEGVGRVQWRVCNGDSVVMESQRQCTRLCDG